MPANLQNNSYQAVEPNRNLGKFRNTLLTGILAGYLGLIGCGGGGGTSTPGPPPNRAPVISSYTVNPNSGTAPLATEHNWDISDPDGNTMKCELDVDGDNVVDYTINNCTSSSTQQHTYNTAGTFTSKLTVTDGKGGLASRTVDVTVNPEQIVFFSDRDHGTGELYLADIENNNSLINILRLTNNTANDTYPAWNPAGTEIVFVSNRDGGKFGIYKMSSLDGLDQAIRITPTDIDALSPSWCLDPSNPNGPGKIYFGFQDDFGKTGIASVNPNGTGFIRLFEDNFVGVPTRDPTCSPDGSEIAYESFRDGDHEVYTSSLADLSDISKHTNLTNNSSRDQQPIWSSDNKIGFITDRDTPSGAIPELNLYRINPDGTGLERLTDFSGNEFDLSWFSDSSRYTLTRASSTEPFQVWIRNVDGTGLVQLTTVGQNRHAAVKPKQ